MNSQSKGLTVVLVVLGATLFVLLGYYFWPDNSPEPEPVAAKSVGQVKAGKPVRVLKLEDQYALVQEEGGGTGWIKSSLLKKPSEIDNPSPNENVLVVTRHVKLFETKPTVIQTASIARSFVETMPERRGLNRIYLTEKTFKQVIAPMNAPFFQDPETREWCWPAYTCHNPECPEKRVAREEPYLFIRPTMSGVRCPACETEFQPTTEEEIRKYGSLAQVYVMPETAVRLKELEAENIQSILDRKARRAKYGPMMKNRNK